MKLKPTEDHLVVELIEANKVTKGGIVLPDGTREKCTRGLVIASGPGRQCDSLGGDNRISMQVRKGNEILFNDYTAMEVEDGIVVIRESDVIAVVEN
jgi:chaperonin GroES